MVILNPCFYKGPKVFLEFRMVQEGHNKRAHWLRNGKSSGIEYFAQSFVCPGFMRLSHVRGHSEKEVQVQCLNF